MRFTLNFTIPNKKCIICKAVDLSRLIKCCHLCRFVRSGIECRDEVFAAHQVQHVDVKPAVAPTAPHTAPVAVCQPAQEAANGAIVAAILPKEERPIPVTELIFTPRKKEMNKGFLMFSQDEGLTSEWHTIFHSLGIRCLLCFV